MNNLRSCAIVFAAQSVEWSIDKFAQHTPLRLMTFIYNAGPGELAAQVNVYKHGRAVLSTPFGNVGREAASDPNRFRGERSST